VIVRSAYKIARLALGTLVFLSACQNGLEVACTNEGATWEVSPSQVVARVGQYVTVSVIQVSCSGRKRVPVYPTMTIADSDIAYVISTERVVVGQAPGTTTLTLTPDNGMEPRLIPVEVP
jgi:hypothetical protein